jgi:predicted RNA binding protein YcfA (HicA-like mRNA interferase family)
MPRRIKVRKLIEVLRALGCEPERTTGSHQTWRTPRGAHLTVVVNHANADVTPTVLSGVRRVLRREGLLPNGRSSARVVDTAALGLAGAA